MDGMKLLRQLFDPGVPEPVEPASVRRMATIMLGVDVLLAGGNIATRFMLPPGPDAGAYDVFLLWNVPGHIVFSLVLLSIIRSSGRLDELGGRLRIMITAGAW